MTQKAPKTADPGSGGPREWRTSGVAGRYRTMHYSAKRGIAIACLSVRPSVCDVGIISGTGKATNFGKFCKHIRRIDRNKCPLKNSGKVAVGVLRDSRKFSGQPYYRALGASSSRGHLCDNSAFLFTY